MSFLLVILLSAAALGLVALTGRRFAHCAPVACFGAILLLYLCGLAGLLRLGVWLAAALAAAGLGYFLYTACKTRRGVWRDAFTPGFAAFLVCSAALLVIVRRQLFFEWDEFSHWGLAVKHLCLSDAFFGAAGSRVVFQTYPPSLSLLPYLTCRLAGAYAESTVYWTGGVFTLALLLPILQNADWKRPFSAALLALSAFLLPLLFFPVHYISAYADATLGLLMGYLLLTYFTAPKRDAFLFVSLGMGAAVLVLAKPTGVVFALLASAVIAADLVLRRRAGDALGKRARTALFAALGGCALLGLAWLAYVAISGAATDPIVAQYTQPGGSLYLGGLSGRLRDVVLSFCIRFVRPVGTGAVPVSPAMWLACFAAMAYLAQKRADADRARTAVYGACVTAGFLVYAGLLLAAYLFAFSEYDALLLSSFDRYIATYALGALVFFFGLFAQRPDGAGRPALALLVAAALLPALPLEQTVTALSRPGERIAMREAYAASESFADRLDPMRDKVCVISQGQDGLDQYIIRYNAAPVPVTFAVSWTLGERKSVYDQWSVPVSPEAWLDEAVRQGCTHVYLFRIEETFAADYASVFTGEIRGDTLYRITIDAAGRPILDENP